jgi:hypothetical protein
MEIQKYHRDTANMLSRSQPAAECDQNKVLAIVRARAAIGALWALHEEAYSASVHKRLLG